MGHRTLKRVPLEFSWPLHKVWEGYQNPHYRKCPNCERGLSPAGEALSTITQRLMWDKPVDEEMAKLTIGLAGRSPCLLGHDTCDEWAARDKIILAAGMPKEWGICKTCGGDCIDPTIKTKYETWEDYGPPKGAGWQLWETCSDGSPVSPVFATVEQLAGWCVGNATTFASFKATYEQWLNMFSSEDGADVGSMAIMKNGKFGAAIDPGIGNNKDAPQ